MPTTLDASTVRDLRLAAKLIPFVGAGLSTRFNLPSWSQLIDIIATELGWDPEVFKLSGDFLQLAEYYVAVKGSIGPLRSLMDKLSNPKDEEILASTAHSALADLRVPVIYTTNFDNIIERAFKQKGVPHHVITNIGDIATMPLDATQIIKFHGTFTDDESLVLTQSHYFERLEFESALDIKLRADILGKSLLFIGYSFHDINIRYMLYKLNKLRENQKIGEDFPMAIMTTFAAGDVQRTLLGRWGVTTIELDPIDRDKSIDAFLKSLL